MGVRHRPTDLKLFLQHVDVADTLGNELEQVVFSPLQRPRDLRQR